MKFGVCAGPDMSATLKQAGFDYVEVGAQPMFQGKNDDTTYDGDRKLKASVLPTPAANSLVPGDLRIVGDNIDFDALTTYMTRTIERAGRLGTKVLVFGSGAARKVPDGFDRNKARGQIVAFLNMAAPLAANHGVTIVAEPLNKGECNIINSVAEAMEYVNEVNHPGFKCLVDSYHFWLEDEPLANLERAMPSIAHVHVADKIGRVAPGESGESDYIPFFKVLKSGGYDRHCSIEGKVDWSDPEALPRACRFLQEAWDEA